MGASQVSPSQRQETAWFFCVAFFLLVSVARFKRGCCFFCWGDSTITIPFNQFYAPSLPPFCLLGVIPDGTVNSTPYRNLHYWWQHHRQIFRCQHCLAFVCTLASLSRASIGGSLATYKIATALTIPHARLCPRETDPSPILLYIPCSSRDYPHIVCSKKLQQRNLVCFQKVVPSIFYEYMY